MERMVLGAVRGTPVTAPSRTEKFRTRARSSTPGPHQPVASSSDELSAGHSSRPGSHAEVSMLQDVSDLPYPDDSDSPTEMALIDRTYNRTVSENFTTAAQQRLPPNSSEEEAETAERSSLDVTLSEVRDQSPGRKSRRGVSTTKVNKPKRMPRRGVPMREEFFSKIGWTRSFISAQPIPSITLTWCGVTCVKRTSVLKPKAPLRFCAITGRKNTFVVTRDGDTNISRLLTR